jgi:hypothetical protein
MIDRIRKLIQDRPTPVKDAAERFAAKCLGACVFGGFLAGVAALLLKGC